MSAHSPLLQFVTGRLDSPKIEVKRVVLVKGPWYEISGSPGLPLNHNNPLRSRVCLRFCFGTSFTSLDCGCIDLPIFLMIYR